MWGSEMGCSPFCSSVIKWQSFHFFMLHTFVILKLILLCCTCTISSGNVSSPDSNKSVLLQFKNSVSDPVGLLASWDPSYHSHCSWFGVLCDSRDMVVSLNITGNGREGTSNAFSCYGYSQLPLYGIGTRRSCDGAKGYLAGKLPSVISELSELRILSLPFNAFDGEIPDEIWGMDKLEVLDLEGNLVAGTLPFLFHGLKNLRVLNLAFNRLAGELPSSLSRFENLEILNLAGNGLNGSVPGFVGKLRQAYLLYNSLSGEIPSNVGENCDNLEHLDLSGNFLAGGIPSCLGNCRQLRTLLLRENILEEAIPAELGLLQNLQVLDVSRNGLNGSIPPDLGALLSLVSLNLSWNQLQGPIPASLGLIKDLKFLSLAGNNLTSIIPTNLGQLYYLEVLDLSSNSLLGEIPKVLMNLRSLRTLLLSNNKLTGEIPAALANVITLSSFNVSFNNISGSLPLNSKLLKCNSAIGNRHIQSCGIFSLTAPSSDPQGSTGALNSYSAVPPEEGSIQHRNGFSSIAIASITSASAIVSAFLALIVLFYTRKWNSRSRVGGSTRKEVTVFTEIGVLLNYESVVQATGNFNASNCIGSGEFWATYKADIAPGILVAIKRLVAGRFQGVQQFHTEIKTLGRLRHPNLVTLIGYHASEMEMFLIYNYLPGGNLEKFIHERSKRAVYWRVLHKIALDIARALAYLHDQCIPRVLHRDVKPSNILLDDDFNAYLSGFGLARLLGTSETHATTGVAGTFGYIAPEYVMTSRVSDKADVYSYGVVLLELLSDKKALDPSFSSFGNGFNIVAWACLLLRQGRAKEFFTAGVWDAGPHDDLVEVLHLAVVCTLDAFSSRPTMKQVVQRLKELQPPSC